MASNSEYKSQAPATSCLPSGLSNADDDNVEHLNVPDQPLKPQDCHHLENHGALQPLSTVPQNFRRYPFKFRDALRVLDRSNAESSPKPLCSSEQRRFTRESLAKLQKKQQPSHSVTDILCNLAPERLSEIKLYARNGGPKLDDIIRHKADWANDQDQIWSSNFDETDPTTNSTMKKISPYDPAFEQRLIRGGIYPAEYRNAKGLQTPPPGNLDEIIQELDKRRPSLSTSRFSDKDFDLFRYEASMAKTEQEIACWAFPFIDRPRIENRYCHAAGLMFTNLDPLIDEELVPGNPDIYCGAPPETLNEKVINDLFNLIVPSKRDNFPLAPNFLLAIKGPAGQEKVAQIQANYDGALGARAMQSLRCYGQEEPTYDNKAYTITSTYCAGLLSIYAIHPTQPTDSRSHPQYHMTRLGEFGMRGSVESFRGGAEAYRNAKDWAAKQRNLAIQQANERAANNCQASALAAVDDDASEAPADVPMLDFENSAKRSNEHLEPIDPVPRKRRG